MALTEADKKQIQELKQMGYSLDEVKAHFGAKKAKRFSTIETDMQKGAEIARQAMNDTTGEVGIVDKIANIGSSIVGGKELARGMGLGMAAPEILESISQAEQQAQDIDVQLIKAIGQAQQEGNEVEMERLATVREQHVEQMKESGAVREEFINSLPTNKQVIGSAVRLAGTLAAPTIAGKATAGFQAAQPVGVLASAAQGAKVGAVGGAIEGAVQGGGLAAEQDKSTAEILYGTVGGAATGGVLGGALGGMIGGVSGLVKGRKAAEEAARLRDMQRVLPEGKTPSGFAEDLASPVLSKKERIAAISQGRLNEPGVLEKANIQVDKRTRDLGEAIKDAVDPRATVNDNLLAVRDDIGRIANGVDDYVTTNKVPFNEAQLRAKLDAGKDDLSLVFASDTSAEKAYDQVVDELVSLVEKKDTAGLLQARQDLDKVPAIKRYLETTPMGENTRKEVVLQVRRQANEYIADQLPKGNTFKADLLKEHLMYEAVGNMAEKLQNQIGKNQIQLLLNQYPALRYVAGTIFGGTVAGAGIAAAG